MRTLVLALLAVFITTMPAAIYAEGQGAKFGARDSRTCKSTKEPARGAPSAEQARQYIICSSEHVSSNSLFLVENVKVEVGKGRPFNIHNDLMTDADSTLPVFPIRGSRTVYMCNPISDILKNKGKNCLVIDEPKSTGVCYKTTFGDWTCHMQDLDGSKKHGQPPPVVQKD